MASLIKLGFEREREKGGGKKEGISESGEILGLGERNRESETE